MIAFIQNLSTISFRARTKAVYTAAAHCIPSHGPLTKLWAAAVLFGLSESPVIAQDIINDAFTAASPTYNVQMSSRAPTTVNLPGGNWQLAARGGQSEAVVQGTNFVPATTAFASAGKWYNRVSSGHTLASSGTYTKPTQMTIAGDLAFGASTNQYLLLGFYSAITPGNTNLLLNFTGLRLNVNGSLALVQNGVVGTTINWAGGAFNPLTFKNLKYDVNTATGAISNVVLAGSAATYNFSSTAFTNSATAFCGAGGVAGVKQANVAMDSVYVDNFKVSVAGGGAGDTDGDGMPDSWEIANGLNPNNAGDAGLDPDADGHTNLAEYGYGTNPNSFNSAGTLAVSVVTADAFEQGLTSARLRITRTGGTVPTTVNFTMSGTATTGDYTVKNASGGTIAGSVPLPFNVNQVDVLIAAKADSLNEYPETAVLTLSTSGFYTRGTPNNATVNVNDAPDTPANEQLFVAMLTPVSGSNSSASGIATMLLNGPKNRARVSVSFNGLTSTQTNAYIRYGVTSGVGQELRPNLGVGQLTDVIWNIVPAPPYSGQEIIDALYKVGGNFIYTNIGTANNPGGEIQGTWSRQTGSSTFTPPPAPPAIAPLTGESLTRDVARFLTSATYGPTKAEIDALVTRINTQHGGDRIAGFNAWIDEQFAFDQTLLQEYAIASDREVWTIRGTVPYPQPGIGLGGLGWFTIAQKAHDQLRQRIAFALSEIFVISTSSVNISVAIYGYTQYYDMLGSYATGNFRDLIETVSKHPIMGYWLSSLKNEKAILDGNGNVLISPDENYAREIMQLFSIGLVQRHPDGSLKLDGSGLPMVTYTYSDIANLSRVFTGWSYSKTVGAEADGYPTVDNNNFYHNPNFTTPFFRPQWTYPMKNFATYHDTGAKTILGSAIPAGLNGEADLDAALNILHNHANVGPFIGRLLIQRLTSSNPSAGYIHRVAQKFNNNGSGVRGDMKAVIKAILLDYEARTLTLTANIGFGKQKEPLIRFMQLMRGCEGRSNLPLSRLSPYLPPTQYNNFPSGTSQYRVSPTNCRTQLGQMANHAPSVFNFFLPDYSPSGPIATAGLFAPEMQITSESSTFRIINFKQQLIALFAHGVPMEGVTDNSLNRMTLNLTSLVTLYDAERAAGRTVAEATTTVLDYLDVVLLSGNFKARFLSAPTPNPRSIIINAVAAMSLSTTLDRMKELLYLVATSPEYAHQK